MSGELPDWERDFLTLQAERNDQFAAWMDKQGYVDPDGNLARAFEGGWMAGAAHVANPAAEDYDRAAEVISGRVVVTVTPDGQPADVTIDGHSIGGAIQADHSYLSLQAIHPPVLGITLTPDEIVVKSAG